MEDETMNTTAAAIGQLNAIRDARAMVLFANGQCGRHAIHRDNHNGRPYVYAVHPIAGFYVRVYVIPGESVEYVETYNN